MTTLAAASVTARRRSSSSSACAPTAPAIDTAIRRSTGTFSARAGSSSRSLPSSAQGPVCGTSRNADVPRVVAVSDISCSVSPPCRDRNIRRPAPEGTQGTADGYNREVTAVDLLVLAWVGLSAVLGAQRGLVAHLLSLGGF